jgi:AcrR family transcriptional regulator
MPAAPPPSEDAPRSRLSRSQAERRHRVLTAAMELADEGGYEAVQMRDVAARADVALGTIYRYFPSKDILLAGVLVEWIAGLEQRTRDATPPGATTSERMIAMLGEGFDVIAEYPLLARAVLQAMVAGGSEVAGVQGEVGDSLGRASMAAFPPGFDRQQAEALARVIGYLWFATLVAWASGWPGADPPHRCMAEAVHLLLDQYG